MAGPAQGVAATVERSEPEVEVLVESSVPTQRGDRAGRPAPEPRSRRRRLAPPVATSAPRSRSRPTTAAADATGATAGRATTSQWSQPTTGRQVGGRVPWDVEDDPAVPATRRRHDLAEHGGGRQLPGEAAPPQPSTPTPPCGASDVRRSRAPRRPCEAARSDQVTEQPGHRRSRSPGSGRRPGGRAPRARGDGSVRAQGVEVDERHRWRIGPVGRRRRRTAAPAADRAIAAASVLAPAPPLPPTTATTMPLARASSPRSASRPASHRSPSGSSTTELAPRVRACRNRSSPADPRLSTWTRSRRGGPDRAVAAAASAPTSTADADVQALGGRVAGDRQVHAGRRRQATDRADEGLVVGEQQEGRGHDATITGHDAVRRTESTGWGRAPGWASSGDGNGPAAAAATAQKGAGSRPGGIARSP